MTDVTTQPAPARHRAVFHPLRVASVERLTDGRPVQRGGEHDGRLGAGLGRETLFQQVLRALGLDARHGEVVLERAAERDRAAERGDQREDDGEGGGAGTPACEESESREHVGDNT